MFQDHQHLYTAVNHSITNLGLCYGMLIMIIIITINDAGTANLAQVYWRVILRDVKTDSNQLRVAGHYSNSCYSNGHNFDARYSA